MGDGVWNAAAKFRAGGIVERDSVPERQATHFCRVRPLPCQSGARPPAPEGAHRSGRADLRLMPPYSADDGRMCDTERGGLTRRETFSWSCQFGAGAPPAACSGFHRSPPGDCRVKRKFRPCPARPPGATYRIVTAQWRYNASELAAAAPGFAWGAGLASGWPWCSTVLWTGRR
jgi:hypothetical protein